jgi:hypothetical protein
MCEDIFRGCCEIVAFAICNVICSESLVLRFHHCLNSCISKYWNNLTVRAQLIQCRLYAVMLLIEAFLLRHILLQLSILSLHDLGAVLDSIASCLQILLLPCDIRSNPLFDKPCHPL